MGTRIASMESRDGCRGMVVRYDAGERFEPHAHDASTMSMVLAGEVFEASPRGACTGRALAQVVKPRGVEHENVFGPAGAVMVSVTVPDEIERQARDAGCGLRDWSWSHASAPAAWLALAQVMAFDGDEGRATDLVAELVGSSAGVRRAASRPPRWIVEVREQLEAGHAPSLAALAAAHGVHRVHLTRCFRQHFGMTPTAARLRAQIGLAMEGLAAGESASAASAMSGFSDQAHMSRMFRRELGMTPGGFMRLAARAM